MPRQALWRLCYLLTVALQLPSGRTPMETVMDAVVAGHLSAEDTLQLVQYLRKEGVKIPREDNGVMLLNRVCSH